MRGTDISPLQILNLNDLLSKAVSDVDSELRGLCLFCVKHGTYREKDGNCRAESECHCLAKRQHETG